MTLPTISSLGISHQTGSAAAREALAHRLQTAVLPADLPHFHLSTCNRIELVASGVTSHELLVWLDLPNLPITRLDGQETAVHLLRVASGLESLVLGEPHILGQVAAVAQTAPQLDPALSALLETAVRCGKRSRTETHIGSQATTMSSIAIRQAQAVLGDLSTQRVLVIGAGQIIQQTIKALQARGIHQIDIANRSEKSARAVLPNGRYYPLAQLGEAVAAARLVITATAAEAPIITANMIPTESAPRVVIDLAMPRDVETAVGHLPHVTLIGIDSLQLDLDRTLNARQHEVPAVEQIIQEELAQLNAVWATQHVTPTIKALRQKAEQIRQTELARTERFLGELDQPTRAHIHHLTQSLVNKLLHEPTLTLRTEAENGRGKAATAAVRQLFGLEPEAEPPPSSRADTPFKGI